MGPLHNMLEKHKQITISRLKFMFCCGYTRRSSKLGLQTANCNEQLATISSKFVANEQEQNAEATLSLTASKGGTRRKWFEYSAKNTCYVRLSRLLQYNQKIHQMMMMMMSVTYAFDFPLTIYCKS